MYKRLLDRESLRSDDGVKYFMDTLRTHFTRGVQSVSLRRCFYSFRAKRENMEVVKWIGKFTLILKGLKVSWMDMLPTNDMSKT